MGAYLGGGGCAAARGVFAALCWGVEHPPRGWFGCVHPEREREIKRSSVLKRRVTASAEKKSVMICSCTGETDRSTHPACRQGVTPARTCPLLCFSSRGFSLAKNGGLGRVSLSGRGRDAPLTPELYKHRSELYVQRFNVCRTTFLAGKTMLSEIPK